MNPRSQPEPPHSQLQFVFERLAVLAISRMATVEVCRILQGEGSGLVVAVKRLPPDYVEDPDLLAMFRDEIWMASALRHPNIARVLGWGEDQSGPYLVTEFVRGVSLARLMRTVFTTGEAFSERLIVFVMASVCAGLAGAHGLRTEGGEFLNVVHRDLTPGNVLLGFDGEVKIVDFGLAKAKQRITQTAIGITKGEPAYMSPEQVCGQQLDGRSDIFTVGVLLYELFAQHRPWTVTNVKEALEQIVEGPVPDLAIACPRIDRALVELVARCLAKKKDERVQTAAELKQHLDEWLRLHGYEDSRHHLARFVRRNALRQMRWLDRALAGDLMDSGASPLEGSHDQPSAIGEPPPEESAPPTPPTAERDWPEETSKLASQAAQQKPLIEDRARRPDEPEATTMRRHRASTETITATPRARDAATPLGGTGGHSILDVRPRTKTEVPADEDALETSLTRTRAHSSEAVTSVHTDMEPRTQRPAMQSIEAMKNAVREIVGSARAAEQQARSAAEAARRAADESESAARRAREMAARADKAAEALHIASQALGAAMQGKTQEALEGMVRAQALHDSAVDQEPR